MTTEVARGELMDRLVNKAGGVRSEATIQADVRMLLLDRDLGLSDVQLEAQVGDLHRRIDVEVGCTVSGMGYSLKRLGNLAGYQWASDGMTGADTYDLIAQARAGNAEAWAALVRYNEEDTRATKRLRDYLRSGSQ